MPDQDPPSSLPNRVPPQARRGEPLAAQLLHHTSDMTVLMAAARCDTAREEYEALIRQYASLHDQIEALADDAVASRQAGDADAAGLLALLDQFQAEARELEELSSEAAARYEAADRSYARIADAHL